MTTKREAGGSTSAEFDAFTATVDKLLSVPKSEILRREAEYRKQADMNPRKRGPKRKRPVD
jgi:hypothetical protein